MIGDALMRLEDIRANLMAMGNTCNFYENGLLKDEDYTMFKEDLAAALENDIRDLDLLIKDIVDNG